MIVLVLEFVMVAVAPVPSVGEFCLFARQEVCTCSDHIRGKGVLLAVENEEIAGFVQLILVLSALVLEFVDSVRLAFEFAEEFGCPVPLLIEVKLVVVKLCLAGFELLHVVEQLGDTVAK